MLSYRGGPEQPVKGLGFRVSSVGLGARFLAKFVQVLREKHWNCPVRAERLP